MHDRNLKIIKISIVFLTVLVVFNMVLGISVLRDNFYWKKGYFIMQFDYMKAKAEFDKYAEFKNKNTKQKELKKRIKTAQNIPVLLYHGVIKDYSWSPDGVNSSFEDFKNQMFFLKRAGWETITLEDYFAFIKEGKNIPEKSFLLTFDDGRKDSYYPVDPILKVLNYNAVMFVITNRSLASDNQNEVFHLSEEELKIMIDSGRWEMQSHGKNDHDPIIINELGQKDHFLSKKMWLSDAKRPETEEEHKARISKDLLVSKNEIEKELGVEVNSFAYPYGDFGETTENFPESRGLVVDQAREVYDLSFCQAASSDFPTNFREDSFLAKRISVQSPMTGREILKSFEYNNQREIDYQDSFIRNNGWFVSRGEMKIGNGAMILTDSELEGSAIAFLGGAYLWQNYSAQADVKVKKTDSFALTARYHDQNNNIACVFSDNYVSLVQKMNSEEVFDERVNLKTDLSSGEEKNVKIVVDGNKASCSFQGEEVISHEIDQNFNYGGTGFKIWDTYETGSSLIIRNFKTKSL